MKISIIATSLFAALMLVDCVTAAPTRHPRHDARAVQLQKQSDELQHEPAQLRQQRSQQDLAGEQSVKPGINKSWKSENLEPLIARLEGESREIFKHSDTIAAAVGVHEGMVVADVGAGSGFMAQIFAKLAGDTGKIYAVDINAKMMERLANAAKENGVENLSTVVCSEKSVNLPPNSIDLMFICDTFHHFEYPRNTLQSIYQAMRPGGQVVVVDFYRIPGVSQEWVFDHVRAGEEVFTQEIVNAGFELINTHYLPQLKENYMLRFRKP